MLKIALVANTYEEAKKWADYKFKSKIVSINHTTMTYTLKNGDVVYLCYDENSKDKYKSMEYDAFVVYSGYESLLDVIKFRCSR